MGKVIQSPVKRWPGTIVLKDPIPFPAYVEWEKAKGNVDLIGKWEQPEDAEKVVLHWYDVAAKPELTTAMLPGLLAVVESWNLENFPEKPTVETFPATPRLSVIKLLMSVYVEAVKVIVGEGEDAEGEPANDPNA